MRGPYPSRCNSGRSLRFFLYHLRFERHGGGKHGDPHAKCPACVSKLHVRAAPPPEGLAVDIVGARILRCVAEVGGVFAESSSSARRAVATRTAVGVDGAVAARDAEVGLTAVGRRSAFAGYAGRTIRVTVAGVVRAGRSAYRRRTAWREQRPFVPAVPSWSAAHSAGTCGP